MFGTAQQQWRGAHNAQNGGKVDRKIAAPVSIAVSKMQCVRTYIQLQLVRGDGTDAQCKRFYVD